MTNNRIFYACQAVAIAKTGHGNGDAEFAVMRGVQSVGLNTSFSLEPVFELGQAELFANVEDVSSIEVTIEKVIDGSRLLYLQAVGASGSTDLTAALNSICDVYLAIYPDTTSSIGNGADPALTPDHVVMCSGMRVGSVSYNYTVDGNATESVTLVGQDKFWDTVTAGVLSSDPATLYGDGGSIAEVIAGGDTPDSGTIARRGQFDFAGSTLPKEIKDGANVQAHNFAGSNGLQNVSISVDFGREDQFELGRYGSYNKTATLPIEVTTSFEVITTKGDLISFSGNAPRVGTTANPLESTIIVKDTFGTVINLGDKNRLSSITQQGGDTGGGNATTTFEYSTYNSFTVDGGAPTAGAYWS